MEANRNCWAAKDENLTFKKNSSDKVQWKHQSDVFGEDGASVV